MALTNPRSALTALTQTEHQAVLAALIDAHPNLRNEAEQAARELLDTVSTNDVAASVAHALEEIALDGLGARVGRIRGRGYVHETEAAWELVTETIEPFRADLTRRANIGLNAAAAALATGIIAGLYMVRRPADGTVLAYTGEDTPEQLAEEILHLATSLNIELPAHAHKHWPQWDELTG